MHENGMFELNQELSVQFDTSLYSTVVGTVREKNKLKEVFEKYKPEIVFHAAAYKHVPMMEISATEAIKNNVFGTLNVINQSMESNVEKFVFISTDKAVNPANVMGASKRIAEMLIQNVGQKSRMRMAAVMREISKKHEIIPIYIDNGGVFWTGKNLTNISDIQNKKLAGRKKIHLRPSSDYIYNENGKKIKKIDVALLCNHGLNGEDGSLQGLLELSGIAYSGSGVRASSAAMDKITMKQLFLQSGLPVLPFISLTYNEFKESKAELNEKIKEKLTFPLIVKPSNLGSSIGITIAHDFKELEDSLSLAFEWDNRVLVENALTDFTELNCAVLGRENDMTASEIEQPTGWKEFLTYDDKYTKKIKGGSRVFPAKITSSQKDAVQLLAKKAFTALGCAGVARCDFLLKDDNLPVSEFTFGGLGDSQKESKRMAQKIKFPTPLVEMQGDEMTRILWDYIKEKLLEPYVELNTDYYDLGLENREETADSVTAAAAAAIKKYGVGVKCATITPNAQRVEEYKLSKMWLSPNGTIRATLDGTVFRAPILAEGIMPYIPAWKKPITIARHAYGDVYKNCEIRVDGDAKAELCITYSDGRVVKNTIADIKGCGIVQGIHNLDESVSSFCRSTFNYALETKQDVWFATKDTISKTYDGRFKDIFASIFEKEYKERFKSAGINYDYSLIDDSVARVVKSGGGFIWALKNYDGDVLSDMVATAYGSLAMMTSVLVSPDNKFEYEAAHGTVTRHYYKHLKGEPTSTNSVATIFAWTGALNKRGELDSVPALCSFSKKLEGAVLTAISSGFMTNDLAPLFKKENVKVTSLNSFEFIDKIKEFLDNVMFKIMIAALSEDERLIINGYAQNETLDDIAQSTGVTKSTVMRRLNRAVKKCTGALSKLGYTLKRFEREYNGFAAVTNTYARIFKENNVRQQAGISAAEEKRQQAASPKVNFDAPVKSVEVSAHI
ncbi:nadp-specific isocitrate dehydrogenase [Holotrichia oblita]|nr:nadp-specific isocitrate dehydrogenase [Holotrichia oblita]